MFTVKFTPFYSFKHKRMKKSQTLALICSIWLSIFTVTAAQWQHSDSTTLLKGRVLALDTRKPLPSASISIRNSNVSTITNDDGYFSIRIPQNRTNQPLIVRHLGYSNKEVSIHTLRENPNAPILLAPAAIELDELEILRGDGAELVRNALHRIPKNYATDPNMMVAFYRESIRKNNNFISLVETVLDVYKESYKTYSNDLARIYIGRKATDVSPRDTLLLKFQGGINDALLVDIAKNPEMVFGENGEYYHFTIERMILINDKPNYVISFKPKYESLDLLFRGTIYLEQNSLAFTRMEFNMNVENRPEAASLFVRHKPSRMRVTIDEAAYLVDYIEKDGKWYFNYSSTRLGLRIKWTNRFFGLFSTYYTVASEMAITDRYTDDVTKFPRSERIKSTDVIAEKVEYFQDPNFWGDYTVIEPNEKIASAIKKLSGKLKRRR